jgi:hypothetical protein
MRGRKPSQTCGGLATIGIRVGDVPPSTLEEATAINTPKSQTTKQTINLEKERHMAKITLKHTFPLALAGFSTSLRFGYSRDLTPNGEPPPADVGWA